MLLHRGTSVAIAELVFSFVPAVAGGFSSSSANNVAIYWGQNSYGAATGTPNAQQRLSYYCSNSQVNIIPLAFLNVISNPSVNFANAGDNCTAFSGSTLLDCTQLEEDIQTCQSVYGKTVMLSVGGATYTEGGFSSSAAANTAANNIWAMFGPVQSNNTANRPFGNAVVDGFDFDFESSTSNMAPFASALRAKMDAATKGGDKAYFLSAAPQCPYPDIADNDMLAGAVFFDFVMVQFYNNYCGLPSFISGALTQTNFNFETWDSWAKTYSKNPNVRVLLGIPGSTTAAGTGYTAGTSLTSVITYVKQFSSFGGIMMWDMSQVYANTGFLDQVVRDLGSEPSTPTSPVNTTTGASTPVSSVTPSAIASADSSVALATTTSRSSSTAGTAISTLRTLTTKSTTPGQVPGNARPTTLSTVTRSTARETPPANGGTGSCGAVSPVTHTVTSYVTISGSNHQAAKSGADLGTPTASLSSPSPANGAKAVQQWGQCGGIGYTGPTQCEAPFTCVHNSVWWAQCQ